MQLVVYRLLRNNDKSLLEQTTFDFQTKGNHSTLTFNHPASPGYLKILLDRAFEAAGVKDNQPFDLHGEGKGEDGRYTILAIDVSSPNVDQAKLDAILAKTKADFAARPQPERLENFDAQLAADTSRRAMYAILLSWGAILLYPLVPLRQLDVRRGRRVVPDPRPVLHARLHRRLPLSRAISAGIRPPFGIEDFKIDLPAVAALLTLVGYSVNDTIVVFDRIREVRGKNPMLTPQMINDSVNQTLSRTILASMTVLLVVIVLYIWGGEGVHLFAFVMVVGVIVGTYSSIYIASPLLLIFGEGAPATARDRKPIAQPAPA